MHREWPGASLPRLPIQIVWRMTTMANKTDSLRPPAIVLIVDAINSTTYRLANMLKHFVHAPRTTDELTTILHNFAIDTE